MSNSTLDSGLFEKRGKTEGILRTNNKMRSLSFRSKIFSLLIILPLVGLMVVQFYISENVRNSREYLVKTEIPIALISSGMLHELGEMNASMLEYVLGEDDGKVVYYDNLDEYKQFLQEIPATEDIQLDINKVSRLVKDISTIADETIFSFDNQSPKRAIESARNVSKQYAEPLLKIFDDYQNRFEQSTANTDNYKQHASSLKIGYQIRIIISALHRYALNDIDAKYIFFDELLLLDQEVEEFIDLQRDTISDAMALEILRLESGIRQYGSELLDQYDVREFKRATASIDEIEHHNYRVSGNILNDIADKSKTNIEHSVNNLENVVGQADFINRVAAIAGVVFIVFYLMHIKTSYLNPIELINSIINDMRERKHGVDFSHTSNSNEIELIISSLSAFQKQLIELEELRSSELMQVEASHLAEQQKAFLELERREKEQRNLATELTKVNEDLEQFVHIASHDLREPLKTISTFSQMLELGLSGSLSEEASELLNVIRETAMSMGVLIDDLRSLTKIYDSSLESSECDLQGLVQSVLSSHAEKIEQVNNALHIGKLPKVIGYSGLIRQIIDNLVRNTLIHGDQKLLFISISGETRGSRHIIEFTNSNIQKTQDAKRLLQPFIKGNETGGTGMGLAICKKIVEVHGGEIEIDNAVENRFTVRIKFNDRYFLKKQMDNHE